MLETERLIIRAPKAEDLQAYHEIKNSDFVLVNNVMEKSSIEGTKNAIEQEIKTHSSMYLEEKDTGEMIGGIFIEEDSLRYGVDALTLSYYLKEEKASKGFMKEALQVFIPYIFISTDIEVLSARVFSGNTPSEKLLLSLGFKKEGTLRKAVRGYNGEIHDDQLYSMMREDLLMESYEEK